MSKNKNRVNRGKNIIPGYKDLNVDVLEKSPKRLLLGTPPGMLGPVEFGRNGICGRETNGGLSLAYCNDFPDKENGYHVPRPIGGVLTRVQALTLYDWMTPFVKEWKKERAKKGAKKQ